jgi:hypothetical protein
MASARASPTQCYEPTRTHRDIAANRRLFGQTGWESRNVTADGGHVLVGDQRPDLLKLCGARENRTPDLLDANESNWTFVAVGRVGRVRN